MRSRLNEILRANNETEKIINETLISLYEREDTDGKNDMLFGLLKQYIDKNDRIADELKELRAKVYGV